MPTPPAAKAPPEATHWPQVDAKALLPAAPDWGTDREVEGQWMPRQPPPRPDLLALGTPGALSHGSYGMLPPSKDPKGDLESYYRRRVTWLEYLTPGSTLEPEPTAMDDKARIPHSGLHRSCFNTRALAAYGQLWGGNLSSNLMYYGEGRNLHAEKLYDWQTIKKGPTPGSPHTRADLCDCNMYTTLPGDTEPPAHQATPRTEEYKKESRRRSNAAKARAEKLEAKAEAEGTAREAKKEKAAAKAQEREKRAATEATERRQEEARRQLRRQRRREKRASQGLRRLAGQGDRLDDARLRLAAAVDLGLPAVLRLARSSPVAPARPRPSADPRSGSVAGGSHGDDRGAGRPRSTAAARSRPAAAARPRPLAEARPGPRNAGPRAAG